MTERNKEGWSETCDKVISDFIAGTSYHTVFDVSLMPDIGDYGLTTEDIYEMLNDERASNISRYIKEII